MSFGTFMGSEGKGELSRVTLILDAEGERIEKAIRGAVTSLNVYDNKQKEVADKVIAYWKQQATAAEQSVAQMQKTSTDASAKVTESYKEQAAKVKIVQYEMVKNSTKTTEEIVAKQRAANAVVVTDTDKAYRKMAESIRNNLTDAQRAAVEANNKIVASLGDPFTGRGGGGGGGGGGGPPDDPWKKNTKALQAAANENVSIFQRMVSRIKVASYPMQADWKDLMARMTSSTSRFGFGSQAIIRNVAAGLGIGTGFQIISQGISGVIEKIGDAKRATDEWTKSNSSLIASYESLRKTMTDTRIGRLPLADQPAELEKEITRLRGKENEAKNEAKSIERFQRMAQEGSLKSLIQMSPAEAAKKFMDKEVWEERERIVEKAGIGYNDSQAEIYAKLGKLQDEALEKQNDYTKQVIQTIEQLRATREKAGNEEAERVRMEGLYRKEGKSPEAIAMELERAELSKLADGYERALNPTIEFAEQQDRINRLLNNNYLDEYTADIAKLEAAYRLADEQMRRTQLTPEKQLEASKGNLKARMEEFAKNGSNADPTVGRMYDLDRQRKNYQESFDLLSDDLKKQESVIIAHNIRLDEIEQQKKEMIFERFQQLSASQDGGLVGQIVNLDAQRTQLDRSMDMMDAYFGLSTREWELYSNRIAQIEMQKNQLMLQSAASTFDQLAEVTATAFGEQSGAYKVMFAASKAAAIAEATLAMGVAMAQASKLPWPANLPAILQAAAAGASIISNIQAVALSFEGGGDTPKGPRIGGVDGRGGMMAIVHPNERILDLEQDGDRRSDSSGQVVSVVQHNTFTGGVTQADLARILDLHEKKTMQSVAEAVNRGGSYKKLIQRQG